MRCEVEEWWGRAYESVHVVWLLHCGDESGKEEEQCGGRTIWVAWCQRYIEGYAGHLDSRTLVVLMFSASSYLLAVYSLHLSTSRLWYPYYPLQPWNKKQFTKALVCTALKHLIFLCWRNNFIVPRSVIFIVSLTHYKTLLCLEKKIQWRSSFSIPVVGVHGGFDTYYIVIFGLDWGI